MDRETARHAGFRPFEAAREALVDLPEVPDDGRPLATRIATVLAAAIAGKTFRQGQRLPPAAAIAHRYNTSVDTGRQALRTLISHGLARRAPGGGTYACGTLTGDAKAAS